MLWTVVGWLLLGAFLALGAPMLGPHRVGSRPAAIRPLEPVEAVHRDRHAVLRVQYYAERNDFRPRALGRHEAELAAIGKNDFQIEANKLRLQSKEPLEDVARLAQAGIGLKTLRLDRPDLETVFLNLTGRRLRDE